MTTVTRDTHPKVARFEHRRSNVAKEVMATSLRRETADPQSCQRRGEVETFARSSHSGFRSMCGKLDAHAVPRKRTAPTIMVQDSAFVYSQGAETAS
jgi:hypothetical protein